MMAVSCRSPKVRGEVAKWHSGQVAQWAVRTTHHSPLTTQHSPPTRGGFTLIELLVVLSIFVILAVMTIGAINLSITSERVRSASRQIQSKLEGARDRAIFNSRTNPDDPQPVGVRLLVDPNEPTICTSLVYIQSPGSDTSVPEGAITGLQSFVQAVDLRPAGLQPALIGVNTSWSTLYSRGLIGPGSRITVGKVGGAGTVTDTIHPLSFPIQTEAGRQLGDLNGNGRTSDEVLFTIQVHPDANGSSSATGPLPFSIPLNPDVRSEEDPLVLPRGTCIDLETSVLPDAWTRTNRMDIMFSARGTVVGDAAAAGIIHLHVVDIRDALENALPGSTTVLMDTDGDPNTPPEEVERAGDELGITIFTKSGRTITHPIYQPSANESPDPWRFGRQGEVAR